MTLSPIRARTRLAWVMLIVLIATGCASKPMRTTEVITPSSAPMPRAQASYPSVALVLGGGALRGFAHVGVIKALEREGIRPHIIVGTSSGSLVGALYASGLTSDALERTALEARLAQFTDYSLWGLGLIKGEALQEFVNEHVDRRPIEALKIPFAAVAADFQTGQMRIFNRGDTGMAVRASSAVPGVFHPVAIDGRRYVDGSLVSPIPVCVARQMGADFVIAADVWYLPQHTSIDNPLNIPFQILHIMAQALSAHQIKAADVAIRPDITKAGRVSFSNRAALVRAGEDATLAAIPEIKLLLSTAKSTPRAKAGTDSCPP